MPEAAAYWGIRRATAPAPCPKWTAFAARRTTVRRARADHAVPQTTT
jgi:hypothetical protein